MRARVWAVAGLLAAAGTACGGGGSGSGFGADYAAVECARVFRCCDATELRRWNYRDEADCRQIVAKELQTNLDQLLAARLITFDADAARACLDTLRAASCVDVALAGDGLDAAACRGIIRGAGAIGAVCEDLDVVCASSNCDVTVGTCGPTRGCQETCGPAQYCDMPSGTCVPFKVEGALCASSAECAPPFVCRTGGCGAILREGDACILPEECVGGDCVTGACVVQRCNGV